MSFGVIEMGLFFGALLVWAIYELVSVRRELNAQRNSETIREERDQRGPGP